MPGATKSRRQGEARQVDTHSCPKCRSNLYAPDFDGWSCVACGYKRRYPRNNTQKAPPSEAETRASRTREWREKRDWNNAKAMWQTIKGQHERTNATPRHPSTKPKSALAKPVLSRPAPLPPGSTPTKPEALPPRSTLSSDPYSERRRAKLNQRYEQARNYLKRYRESGDPADLSQADKLLRECLEHAHAAKSTGPLRALEEAIADEYVKRMFGEAP